VFNSPMVHARIVMGLMLSGIACCSVCHAGGTQPARNPFSMITQRNVFRLRPVPPPVKSLPPPVVLPAIILEGITTMLHDKRAMFSVKFPPVGPKPAAQEDYFLREGEQDGLIEVVKIDTKAEEVVLDVSGTRMVVRFDTKSAASSPKGETIPAVQAGPRMFRHRHG